MLKKVAFIFGTRPEAIKLCPLILAFQQHPKIEPHVCVTGQHREMLDQALEIFGVKADVDLGLMEPGQTLGGLTSRAIGEIDKYLDAYKPDLVIVQGDTTTVFCAALSAFYHQIPVGHVEAGLRTWNRRSPYPEETNRVLTTRLTDLHFAPTATSKQNLLREEIPEDAIVVTGNSVIDALFIALEQIQKTSPVIPGLPARVTDETNAQPLVLITGHRRENFGQGFEDICEAIHQLSQRYPEASFVYPVHLNPNVRGPVRERLGSLPNVHLIEPLSYLPFVALMARSTLVLTDSGGVQEEAPSLGKPVLVMRDTTERPEAVEMGTVKLVGTGTLNIVEGVSSLLDDKDAYNAMANAVNPYGDGKAAERILNACTEYLGV